MKLSCSHIVRFFSSLSFYSFIKGCELFFARTLAISLFYILVLSSVCLIWWAPDGSLGINLQYFIRGCRSAALPALCLGALHTVFNTSLFLGRFRHVASAFLTVTVCALSVSELWMSQMLHSRWSDRILRLIADTNSAESSQFLSEYLFAPGSLAVLIAFPLFLFVVFSILKYCKQRLCHSYCRLVFLPLAPLVVVLLLVWWSLPRENDYDTDNSLDSLTRLWKMEQIYRKNSNVVKALERTPSLADAKLRGGYAPPARIIWVIGESDSKAHWSLYGYRMPTVPHMEKLHGDGDLIVFDDVICYEPRTYRMMEILFSPHVVGESYKMYFKTPLTPMLLRKAGYTVRLHDNQATLVRGDDQAEVGTCNFMNSRRLSEANFDYRNDKMYRYDLELVDAEGAVLTDSLGMTVDIFHLNGQHFSADKRYPAGFGKFSAADYDWRHDLDVTEKSQVAAYDNATLYVDTVLASIYDKVKGQDAVVVYHPDHGEEMNDERHCHVRTMDSHRIRKAAPYVLEIPFIVFVTPKFRESHPELYKSLLKASKEKFSLIYFSHFLLDLAGIDSKYFSPQLSPLSESWSAPERKVKDIGSYDEAFKSTD